MKLTVTAEGAEAVRTTAARLMAVPRGETLDVELRAVLAATVARLWEEAGVPPVLHAALHHLPTAVLGVSYAMLGPRAPWLHVDDGCGLTPHEMIALYLVDINEAVEARAEYDDADSDVASIVEAHADGALAYDITAAPLADIVDTAGGIVRLTTLLGHPVTELQLRMAGPACPPVTSYPPRPMWRLGDVLAYSIRHDLREDTPWTC